MDVEAVIVQFSPPSDCWVDMWGEHYDIEGCVVKSADGEGALACVRWRMGLLFTV